MINNGEQNGNGHSGDHTLTTRQGHPVTNNQSSRTVGNDIIERQLDKEMVKSNFNLNFRNVFQHFHYFDFAYFINNSTETKGLKAPFTKGTLIYLKRNDDQFLKVLRGIAFERGYLHVETQKMMSTNEDCQNPLFNWPNLDI